MTTLHIFNPETDFALAHGANYTPPASIVGLRKKGMLTPTLYCREHDWIYVADIPEEGLKELPYYDIAVSKGIKIACDKDICAFNGYVLPWGWNQQIRNQLINRGVAEHLLKTEVEIETLRSLSHRRNAALLLRYMYSLANMEPPYPLPIEITDMNQLTQWLQNTKGGYIKAPWSSSGRGVRRALREDDRTLLQWAKGTLRRQNSIMAEVPWNRTFDFATEWWMTKDGKTRFLGYSVFEVDFHSQYIRNVTGTQEELKERINKATNYSWDKGNWLEIQKLSLEQTIGHKYNGPLGIDCLADEEGNVNPCVEVNMRLTMGMASLHKELPPEGIDEKQYL